VLIKEGNEAGEGDIKGLIGAEVILIDL